MTTAIQNRVSDVEKAIKELAYAQLRTEVSLGNLSDEMLHFKDEMKDFKGEMKAFKDEMLDFKGEMKDFKNEMLDFKDEMKAFKNEMLDFKDEMKDFKNEMLDFKDEMKGFKNEMRGQVKQMNIQWGNLANRLGTFTEDIVAPNIPGMLKRYFGIEEPDAVMVRVRKRHPDGKSRTREFDVIAIAEEKLFLNETKATIRRNYLEGFVKEYREIFDYFPEYSGKKLIPIISSLFIPPAEVSYLSKKGILAMMMAEDSMDLVNFDKVFPVDAKK